MAACFGGVRIIGTVEDARQVGALVAAGERKAVRGARQSPDILRQVDPTNLLGVYIMFCCYTSLFLAAPLTPNDKKSSLLARCELENMCNYSTTNHGK